MINNAFKIAVIESEAGWGRKIDNYMVCLSLEDIESFRTEFNSKNDSDSTPDWYMQVEGDPISIYLNDNQYECVFNEKKVWLSRLKNV